LVFDQRVGHTKRREARRKATSGRPRIMAPSWRTLPTGLTSKTLISATTSWRTTTTSARRARTIWMSTLAPTTTTAAASVRESKVGFV